MPGAITRAGKWRIKPSGKLPIFLRFMINSSFTPENAAKINLKNTLPNRTFLRHMMYWRAEEYDKFEAEVIGHLKLNDGWYEKYAAQQLALSEHLYKKGDELKKIDWTKKSNSEITVILTDILREYRELACAWYVQYPLDEYFEEALEKELAEYLPKDHPDFGKIVFIFSSSKEMTEVSQERQGLLLMAKDFLTGGEDFDALSAGAKEKIAKHLEKFAYINRGLGTGQAFTFSDVVDRLKEARQQTDDGKKIDDLIYEASEKKVSDEFQWALGMARPKNDFTRLIEQARSHTYLRNRRVEAFFKADHGASFMYQEIAVRTGFNPDWIMEISVPEMFGALSGAPLPSKEEMARRFEDYAMVVRDAETLLITDPAEIKKLEQEFFVETGEENVLKGKVACKGGIIRGPAKVCLDKKDINKVERGDILVANFTTPDFVPAMERAAAIVTDQGGISSHAAIVSRELGVPCIIATGNGTMVIKDGDLVEVDAEKGIVKIIKKV